MANMPIDYVWQDPEVAEARKLKNKVACERNGIEVEFKSLKQAFTHYGIPLAKGKGNKKREGFHAFRLAVKAAMGSYVTLQVGEEVFGFRVI